MATVTATKSSAGECQFVIDGEMNIYAAGDLREQLLEHIDQCDSLEFDLAGVSELDTSGFQLLLQVKRECNAAGKEVRLTAHSPAILEVFELFGMEDFFGDPLVLLSN